MLKKFLWLVPLTVLIFGAGGLILNQSNSQATPAPIVSSTPTPHVSYARPARLVIPALGVDAQVEQVGLDAEKRMAVPSRDELVGWYEYGPVPGQPGSSVMAGHFDSIQGTPAVFYALDQLQPGDEVHVEDVEGNTRIFEVLETRIFPDATFPLPLVFEQQDAARLNLITCDGVFDQGAANYTDRLVVFTRLKG